ncbi:MAG TPA: OmpA family protein [Polyangiales bacterium]|nr:OmpA family protein [Polyangiales bacterium]
MSDRRWRELIASVAALSACVWCASCGPSAAELAARSERDELKRELAEVRQYNDDLKFRLQLVQARSKVLLGLVQGLTIDPDHFAPTPEKLAHADASLKAIDSDVDALVATVRSSRQDAAALREQREALQRELADARRTIEHARANRADVDARTSELQHIIAPLSDLIRGGRVNVSIAFGRFSIELPEAALFPQSEPILSEHGKSLLERVTAGLRSAPDRQVRVTAPTDALGKHGAAQRELTLARSIAVLDYLRANGVTAEGAVTTTYEKGHPPHADRFFAISLVPNAQELPKLPDAEQLLAPAP